MLFMLVIHWAWTDGLHWWSFAHKNVTSRADSSWSSWTTSYTWFYLTFNSVSVHQVNQLEEHLLTVLLASCCLAHSQGGPHCWWCRCYIYIRHIIKMSKCYSAWSTADDWYSCSISSCISTTGVINHSLASRLNSPYHKLLNPVNFQITVMYR